MIGTCVGQLRKATSYRNRAQECGAMASDFRDVGRKRVLESLADDYEETANQVEEISMTAQRLRP